MMEYDFQGWVIKYIVATIFLSLGSLPYEAYYLVVTTVKQPYGEAHVVRN